MQAFSYQGGVLHAENVPLHQIATQFGTPVYVYSKAALTEHYAAYANACKQFGKGDDPALICFSVKSNANLAVLNLLAKQGSGFDIVSGGELQRVLHAGGDPQKVIYSGVGKTADEIRMALEHDILCFNVESLAELHRINDVAGKMRKQAPISFRVNPDVDAQTHPYISTGLKENKFGVDYHTALDCYRLAATLPHIRVKGIDCHIGSQILDDAPLLAALDKLIELVDRLGKQGIPVHHLNIGGGVGITYNDEKPVKVADYVERLFKRINHWRLHEHQGRPIKLLFEPGRSIAGNAGLLLTTVQYLKENPIKNFAIVDAAMNDLLRPAIYEAWHRVLPVQARDSSPKTWDVVGPICESGDWLARERQLAIQQGDLLAVMSAGAYGMAMASNYNSRPRAPEVMIDGSQAHLIRQREKIEDLFALESLLPG